MIIIKCKSCWNVDSYDPSNKKAFSNLLEIKTYWIVALRMTVLVSKLDMGSPGK